MQQVSRQQLRVRARARYAGHRQLRRRPVQRHPELHEHHSPRSPSSGPKAPSKWAHRGRRWSTDPLDGLPSIATETESRSVPEIPDVALRQSGVFSRAQAYDAGWSPRQVRRRLDAGRWRPIAGAALCAAPRPSTVSVG
ncbi:MAG: type IV toxin-antitoxin system AbiEi family antitoxin domain-containing protein [Actinomycetales bacterium]